MKSFYSILLVLVLGGGAVQGHQVASLPDKSVVKLSVGEDRVQHLLAVAESQLFLAGIYHRSYDSALLLIRRATQLADTLGSFRSHNECLCMRARYYFATKGVQSGRDYIMQLIAVCRQRGDRVEEARCWHTLARGLPRADTTYSLRLSAFRTAFDLYLHANDADGALEVFGDWELMEQSYHRKMSPDMLISVAALYLYKDYEGGFIRYALTAKDTIRRTDLPRWFGINYLYCEDNLRNGLEEAGLPGARMCLDMARQNNYPELFYVARLVVAGLIKKDSAQGALRLMQRITHDRPSRSALESRAVSWCYGMIYDHLGQPAMAERYFMRVMRQDSGFFNEPKGSLFLSLFFQPAETAIGIAAFYIRRGKFREARNYLQRVVNDPVLGGQVADRRAMELLLFRASQALGDYRSAVQYHKQYEKFDDSLTRIQMLQTVMGGLLSKSADDQHIGMIAPNHSEEEERVKLKRADFERNAVLAALLILLLASAFVLCRYLMEKRNVFQLRQQQSLIHRQNQILQQLIEEKDRLLADKDLLMREIHHRVKNNLNIINSLLESQSLYLNNDAARAALQDTQNRVHAVFLLHEKLYGSTTVQELNVHAYFLELINHLYESFDLRNQHIVITHMIEPIYLNTSEVLPLAVILNEAVTNALKYAFPDGRKGEIHFTLRQTAAGMVQMQIRDNGVGFTAGYSPHFGKTLGFTLITGLANQLRGYYRIENDGGVVITIRFRPKERIGFAGLVLSSN